MMLELVSAIAGPTPKTSLELPAPVETQVRDVNMSFIKCDFANINSAGHFRAAQPIPSKFSRGHLGGRHRNQRWRGRRRGCPPAAVGRNRLLRRRQAGHIFSPFGCGHFKFLAQAWLGGPGRRRGRRWRREGGGPGARGVGRRGDRASGAAGLVLLLDARQRLPAGESFI